MIPDFEELSVLDADRLFPRSMISTVEAEGPVGAQRMIPNLGWKGNQESSLEKPEPGL